MERKYKYYLVKGGKALEAINQFEQEWKDAHEKGVEFQNRFNASGTVKRRSVVGLIFDGNHPAGWEPENYIQQTEAGGEVVTYYRPSRRTKEGKALNKEMQSIAWPGGLDFISFLGSDWVDGGRGPNGGFTAIFPTYEKIGEDYVLIMPIGVDGKSREFPGDGEELKASEYWLMKEQAS
jgi:hypothetical protein